MRFVLRHWSTCAVVEVIRKILEVVIRQIPASNLMPYVVFTGLERTDSFEQY